MSAVLVSFVTHKLFIPCHGQLLNAGLIWRLITHTEAGSVTSQQTQLQFSCQPPSPLAAPSLPQCVVQERGGENRFAMSTQTQLRFNLAVPPDRCNLPTHFCLHPSPVVIERLPPKPSSLLSTSERLALAVRLAKRDLQKGVSFCLSELYWYCLHHCVSSTNTVHSSSTLSLPHAQCRMYLLSTEQPQRAQH